MAPDPPTLAWQPHPDVWLLLVVLVGGYFYALSVWGPRFAPGRSAATRNQRALFLLGAAALWIVSDWPVHVLADDYLYSVHMVQHVVYQLIAAPLLILGTPAWLWRRLLRPRPVFVVVRAVTKPLPALLIVSGYIAYMHWPAVVNTVVTNDGAHLLAHVGFMLTGFVLWWPVLSPLPELPHLPYLGRMAYLFGHSILPTVPASFLTFAHNPLYAAYEAAPRLSPWLDAVHDQQIAGLIMKVLGGFLLWVVIAVLFFRWHAEEESGGPDPLYWRDLEPEFEPKDTTPP